MDEKQKKQVEIIKNALKANAKAYKELSCAKEDILQAVQSLLKDLDIVTIMRGHSENALAASALVGFLEQLEQIL